jgi:hypothetical protein
VIPRQPRPLRRPPRVVVVVELEGLAQVRIEAETEADERRVLAWLLRPRELPEDGEPEAPA